MFTGIVTAIGTIDKVEERGDLHVTIACPVDHGQAHARTGDRGAHRDPGGVEGAADDSVEVARLTSLADRADGGDYSGEHYVRS